MQTAPAHLAPNVYMPMHPILKAKLSQLRDQSIDARAVKALVHEITLFVAYEALRYSMTSKPLGPAGVTPRGDGYTMYEVTPDNVAIVPILRSGLAMVDAIQQALPRPAPVHHLGLYREVSTLDSIEYYNSLLLDYRADGSHKIPDLAIVCDPLIATGATSAAALQILKNCGVKKAIVISVLGASEGLDLATKEWPEGCELWIAGLDNYVDDDGDVVPGIGDIGKRLYGTIGR